MDSTRYKTGINGDGGAHGNKNDDGVASDDTTTDGVAVINDTTMGGSSDGDQTDTDCDGNENDPDYNPFTDEEGSRNADSPNDNDDFDDNDEDADIPPLYSPSIDVEDDDGEGNESDSHTIASTGIPDNEGTSGNSSEDSAKVNLIHLDPNLLFDVTFDELVKNNLREIEVENGPDNNGPTKTENLTKAVSISIRRAFDNDSIANAAKYLMEYLRNKLAFGYAAVQVFMEDAELRRGLLECNGLDLPDLDPDDFRKLFLLHEAPSLFFGEGDSKKTKTEIFEKQMRCSSKRLFELVINAHPNLKGTRIDILSVSNENLRTLNGFNYCGYATPSILSFDERYTLHTKYAELKRQNVCVVPDDILKFLPGEYSDPASRKRIRIRPKWKSSKPKGTPSFLRAATQVTRELNMQVAETTLQLAHKEREDKAIDLPEGVQRLEVSKEQPNNIFVNELLDFFADSYLDRRWRENEKRKRPVPSVSDPVEYYPGRNSYAFAVDNGISEDLVNRIVEQLGRNDDIEFIYPDQSGGGREGSYMRMAFRDGGESVPDPEEPGLNFRPFFLIGNEVEGRQKIYLGVQAVPLEIEIMDMIENMVRPMVNKAYGPDYPFEVVMIQHVISDCRPYSDHNDNNRTTTSTGDSDPYRTSRGSKLPTFEQSITVTICFEERKSDGAGLYTIIWKRDKDEVCRMVVGPRAVHVQCPGMNYSSMKHGVYVNQNLIKSLGWRWVISARMLIYPRHSNLKAFKEHLTEKTLGKLRKPEELIGHDKASLVTSPLMYLSGDKTHRNKPGAGEKKPKRSARKRTGDGRFNLSLFKNTGRYFQCSYDHVRKNYSYLVDIPRKIKHNTHPSLLCCGYKCLSDLVWAGIIPVIERTEKANETDKQTIQVNYSPLFCFEEDGYFHFPVKFRTYEAKKNARQRKAQVETQRQGEIPDGVLPR